MSQGIDWNSIVSPISLPNGESLSEDKAAAARSLPSVAAPPPVGDVTFFILRNEKWEEDVNGFIVSLPLKTVWKGHYLIRVKWEEHAVYFCGSDAVYFKVAEDKRRVFIMEILNILSKHIPVCPEFWELPLKKALHLMMVHQVLGGTFQMVPF